jgi:oligopeptide/dipeptide ABC transporter ATP-binding protein
MMDDLLAIEDLSVRYATVGPLRAWFEPRRSRYIDAVLDVSLRVSAGQTVGLVGESGSGKTSLARAVIGLVSAHRGSIRFRGRELVGLSDRALKAARRNIGMMFQDPLASLSPRMTVRSLLAEPFRIHGVVSERRDASARRLLGMVGLDASFLDAYPHRLSGGQARRVGVARALALNPALIIADEPTAGLDVSVQGEILNLLSKLQGEFGLGYLIVTHNLPVIRHVSDRLAIMYLGRLIEDGPTDAIFAGPAHPYTAALIESVPKPDPDRRRASLALEGEIPSLRQRPSGCEFHTRCRFAQPLCRMESPPYQRVAPSRHVRCHFPLQ